MRLHGKFLWYTSGEMSDNFYPPPPLLSAKHYAILASAILAALAGGISVGYWIASDGERPTDAAAVETPEGSRLDADGAAPPPALASLPDGPFKAAFEEGQLLAYRLDSEIEGGGTESGDFSEVYMKFGSDVTLYTEKVADDGVADMRFVFEHASVAGTFFESPFEISFDEPTKSSGIGVDTLQQGPQYAFLTTPIEMRVAPDGTVLDISSPGSFKDMLGSIAAIPHIKFPNTELVEGMEWETKLKLPVPGIGDAIDTTVHNKLIGRERMGNYDCGVVLQRIGARGEDTKASVPDGSAEKPMLFSVPLFDLQGENTIHFDLKTGRLIHATLDMDFALRIKEQLGDVGKFLQQLVPDMAGENTSGGLEDLLHPDGKSDLMDFSLKIDGAMSLVNEGTPLPMPQ